MNPNAKLDASLRRQARIALDYTGLHLDRATHGVDHPGDLDDRAVAGAFDDAAVMRGDCGIDEIATEAPQARQGPILVRPGESAIANNVCDQDCSELARFPGAPSGR